MQVAPAAIDKMRFENSGVATPHLPVTIGACIQRAVMAVRWYGARALSG